MKCRKKYFQELLTTLQKGRAEEVELGRMDFGKLDENAEDIEQITYKELKI